MSVVPQLIPIEISNDKRRVTVLTNIIKMMTSRKILKQADLDKNIEKVLKTNTIDFVYSINTDEGLYMIKLLQQKITAVSKTSGINEFLTKYKNEKKLIVVNSISNKASQYIATNYPNTEIFLDERLMINIIDHIIVPKHEVLSKEDAELVLTDYNAKKRDMPKIFTTDPIAEYYNMKPGQICRITRPSETSGEVIFYRLVVKGSVKPSKA